MKFTLKGAIKKISNLPDEIKFKNLKENSKNKDFSEYKELADCYAKGIGTYRNYKEALKWYIKAAECGSAKDKYHLGMMFWKGEKIVGGVQDISNAILWIESAKEQGSKEAEEFLEKYYASLSGDKLQEVVENYKFKDIQSTVVFASNIQDTNKQEEFIVKALGFFKEAETQELTPLLNLLHDKVYLCEFYISRQHSEYAEHWLQEKEYSKDLEWQLTLAKAYEKTGNLDKAFKILSISASKRVNSSKEEYLAFIRRIGGKLEESGDYSKAEIYFSKAMGFNQSMYADFLCRWGDWLTREGRYIEAIETFDRAGSLGANVKNKQKLVESSILKESGDNYDLIKKIQSVETMEALEEYEDIAEENGLENLYESKAISIIKKAINNANTLDELEELEFEAEDRGLEQQYKNRKSEIAKANVPEFETIEELDDWLAENDLTENDIDYKGLCCHILVDSVDYCNDFDEVLDLRDQAIDKGIKKEFYKALNVSEADFNQIEEYLSGTNSYDIYELDEIYGVIENSGISCIQDKLYDMEEEISTQEADDRMFIDPERIHNLDYNVISSCGFNLYCAYKNGSFEDMVKAYSYDSDDSCIGDIYRAFEEKEPSPEKAIAIYEKYGEKDFFVERLKELYFELGEECENKRDIESAVENYQKAAEYGNSDAKKRLEELYK